MNKIYVLSGLGVDERVFDTFEFNDSIVRFISWIPPLKKESLADYAKRIAMQIEDEHPVIIGLSFGGMVAVEIAKIRKVKKVIVLASAKERAELPKLYLFIGQWRLHRLMPSFVLKQCNFLTYWFFGVHTEKEKKMLQRIILDTDERFLTWAIHAILTWQNKEIPGNLVHIHGSKDHILPCNLVKYDYLIEGGGHFMTVNRAQEIEQIIREVI